MTYQRPIIPSNYALDEQESSSSSRFDFQSPHVSLSHYSLVSRTPYTQIMR
jgi:hypothetical protein